jgi:diguanylate cyclase (GGDEF)-like protein
VRRALAPLSALQTPLARLAQGDTEVQVSPAGDREIAAIGSALNVTIAAIRQRDAELRRLAENDPLTGLVNRASFMRELEAERTRLAQQGGESAVLFFDLDQFKYINDTLGHAAGDRLLVQVANVLRSRTRASDVVSRFGGDEFLVLARDVSLARASDIARSLNELMRDFSLVEGGQAMTVNFSIGIAMLDGDRHSNEEILAQADMACYAAKTRGRNRYHVYQPGEEERSRMTSDIGWSQRVKQAIREDRFRLVYQPIQGVRSGAVEHYEVLVRLPVEGGEVVLPGVFLPVAQRFGFLAEIDRWVIRHALAALAAVRAEGRDVCFSINLSSQGLEDATLLDLVREQLAQHGLPAGAVVFEITEQTAVRYLDHAQHVLQGLIGFGCRLALDDFGKGFSSLSYLKHLPVEFIKIDGAFVRNLGDDPIDQAMVRSIVQVAQALDKQTIAEFVQDQKSVELLRAAGVDYLQGYFIGRPADELPQLRRNAACG